MRVGDSILQLPTSRSSPDDWNVIKSGELSAAPAALLWSDSDPFMSKNLPLSRKQSSKCSEITQVMLL